MGRKHPKETYKQANIELLREKLKESKYTWKDVSVILGYASSWFDNMLMRNTPVSEIDMNKMAWWRTTGSSTLCLLRGNH